MWWEIAAETGDARAISDLGLHGGKLPPMKTRLTKQANTFGEAASSDARTARQIRDEIYLLRNARLQKKAAQEAAKYAARNLTPPPGPRGGGSEYGVLVSAVTLTGAGAMKLLGLMTVVEMYSQAEQVFEWWSDHVRH